MAPPHGRLHRNRTPRIAAAGGRVLLALVAMLVAVAFAAPAGAAPKATPPGHANGHGHSPAPEGPTTATPPSAAAPAALPHAPAPTPGELREARQRLIAEHKALEAQRARERHEANEVAAQERHLAALARKAEGQARHERENVEVAQRQAAHREALVAQHAAVQAANARKRERGGHGSGGSTGSGSGGSTGSGSSAPSHATPAPDLTPAAPVPVAAAPAPVIGAAPAPAHRAAAPARRAPARRHTRGRPAIPALGRTALPALPAISRPAAAPARGAKARTPRGAARHAAPQGPAAIVNTVTKFINVVPPLVRILIGVLAALAIAFGIASRVAAMRARRLARQRRELLEDVGLLQAALLPELPARIGPVATSAAYRPASGPAAGGDFFDVFALADGRVAVIVGDVSGHGRQALPHTTLVRFTLRTYLEAGAQPAEALQAAAPALERQLDESFATVAVATYEPGRRLLVYSCAGHPAPLILGSEPTQHLSACSAPPIGIGEPTGTRETAVRVPGEAVICFYTDGVVEARTRGALYGQDRLAAAVGALGPDATATELLERVASECDHHPDDMAACLLHISGAAAPPAVERERLELDRSEASRPRARRLLLAAGVSEPAADSALASARALLRAHARVVLEVSEMDSRPSVQVWPQNVSLLPAGGMRPRGAVEGGR